MGSLTRFNLEYVRNTSGIDTVVETGTGRGNSLDWAARSGFSELYSVEQVPHLFESSRQRFADHSHIHLQLGDSASFLQGIVSQTLPSALYFLDAHFAGGADFGLVSYAESGSKEESYPLLTELEILLKSDLSSSIIIVDDMRMYFEETFQGGECPEFARRWHEKNKLLSLVKRLEATHTSHLLHEDEGYLIATPKSVPFDKDRWIFARPTTTMTRCALRGGLAKIKKWLTKIGLINK